MGRPSERKSPSMVLGLHSRTRFSKLGHIAIQRAGAMRRACHRSGRNRTNFEVSVYLL